MMNLNTPLCSMVQRQNSSSGKNKSRYIQALRGGIVLPLFIYLTFGPDDINFAPQFRAYYIQMKLSQFKFELPKELIAQEPLKTRHDSRLLVVHTKEKKIE